jgi:hypothetical protein
VALRIVTNFTPALTVDTSVKKVDKSGSLLLRLVSPSVTVDLGALGSAHYAPYGEPSQFGWSVLLVILGLAVYGLFKLISSLRR